jgi:SAM-dependent methyltransferase
MVRRVPRRRQARVFGRDPRAYDRGRLGYPSPVWRILRDRCGLRRGSAVLEIGPGTGIATRELLRSGAGALTLVEPDPRLVRYLRRNLRPGATRVRYVPRPFDRARLPEGEFDLVVAGQSFHWLPARASLRKIARALRPGGWWAAWGNQHGDPYRPSRFQEALQPLYRRLAGGRLPRGDRRAEDRRERAHRFAAVRAVPGLRRPRRDDVRWTKTLSASEITALWATFSEIQTLPAADRRWFLGELDRLVRTKFRGRVRMRILTPVYTAQRRPLGTPTAPRRRRGRRPVAGRRRRPASPRRGGASAGW